MKGLGLRKQLLTSGGFRRSKQLKISRVEVMKLPSWGEKKNTKESMSLSEDKTKERLRGVRRCI